jgi:hypothetical protein
MSSSGDSERFFRDAVAFFTELERTIQTNHQSLSEKVTDDTTSLRNLLTKTNNAAERTILELQNAIQELKQHNNQQNKQIEQLQSHISILQQRVDTLTASPFPLTTVPNFETAALTVKAEDADVLAIASNTPQTSTKSSKSSRSDKTAKSPASSQPASAPTMDTRVTAAAVDDQSITPRQSNAIVLAQFLALEQVTKLTELLKGLPKHNIALNRHLSAINKLHEFSFDNPCPPAVFAFGLNVWFMTLLLKDKKTYFAEMETMYTKINESKSKSFHYPDNEKLAYSLKNSAFMTDELREIYRLQNKEFIRNHSNTIRKITIALETQCEDRKEVTDSQAWLQFLNKWVNNPEESVPTNLSSE